MTALSNKIEQKYRMKVLNINHKYKVTKTNSPIDLKKELLKKAIEHYKMSNNGIFDEVTFKKDLIEILYMGIVNDRNDDNCKINKYINKRLANVPQIFIKTVIEMNNREEKRNALINKLKLEHAKFLNSPTAKLMIQINKDYGMWDPDEELVELPLLPITLSEEIDSGREERI